MVEDPDISVINELEQLIGEPLPELKSPPAKSGYQVKNDHIVNLRINDKNLLQIPESIGELRFIKTLDLSQNNLQIVPDYIKTLENLKNLALASNRISEFNTALLKHFPRLEGLFLSQNRLESINLTPLKYCNHIKFIGLAYNSLREIDLSPLQHCPSLESLHLEDNMLTTIDLSPLRYCRNLEFLDISSEGRLQAQVGGGPIASFRIIDLTPLAHCPKVQVFLPKKDIWSGSNYIAAEEWAKPALYKLFSGSVRKRKIFGEIRWITNTHEDLDPLTSKPQQKTSQKPLPTLKENESILSLPECPICNQSHKYQLKIERTLSLIAGDPKLIELAYGAPAAEVTDLSKTRTQKYTKTFICPQTKQSFEYSFISEEKRASSVISLEVERSL